jgi:hypothetical protein
VSQSDQRKLMTFRARAAIFDDAAIALLLDLFINSRRVDELVTPLRSPDEVTETVHRLADEQLVEINETRHGARVRLTVAARERIRGGAARSDLTVAQLRRLVAAAVRS